MKEHIDCSLLTLYSKTFKFVEHKTQKKTFNSSNSLDNAMATALNT